MELCGSVHIIQRQTPTQITTGFSTHFIGICVGLGLGVGQCECTIVFGSLIYGVLNVKTPRLCLHVPSTSQFLPVAPLIFLTDTLMGKMEVQPILPVKVTATIDTMLNFDGDFDRHGEVMLCSHLTSEFAFVSMSPSN